MIGYWHPHNYYHHRPSGNYPIAAHHDLERRRPFVALATTHPKSNRVAGRNNCHPARALAAAVDTTTNNGSSSSHHRPNHTGVFPTNNYRRKHYPRDDRPRWACMDDDCDDGRCYCCAVVAALVCQAQSQNQPRVHTQTETKKSDRLRSSSHKTLRPHSFVAFLLC
jgi:hypothetical protein